MVNLIKADFKKILFLSGHRNYLLVAAILSIVLGFVLLLTIEVTEGKRVSEMPSLEVIDVALLGIDVTAIMLIIFIAVFIAKEFSQGTIHISLAITPQRQKFYYSKILFTLLLSLVMSIILTVIISGLGLLLLSAQNMETVSLFDQALLFKLVGAIFLASFYGLLSAVATFYFRAAAGGITFSLGVMFIPALIKMFPPGVSDAILFILPERSLHVLTEMNAISVDGPLISALLILLSWILISSFLGLGKFKKIDF